MGWFRYASNVLCYARDFALFALRAVILRGMPRSEPGMIMRGPYEKKLNAAYFILSPLLLIAAAVFGVVACGIALVSVIIGGLEQLAKRWGFFADQPVKPFPPAAKPAAASVMTHERVIDKLAQARPVSPSSTIIIPESVVPIDEEIEEDYSSSANSISPEEESSVLGNVVRWFI